ncbi:hypothetical protein LGL08_08750 [Clostridium estertheticum]|uniref:hypothetical protein n=1 Tax=Clostridium estertheticum TaxID=238834 RepID=UPI001CF2717E|nr:hypothetical protein [Clostridium estertheticum]MCB2306347.1 hypothetical protein [Clostridium estertheticum]MCB2344723.1 hypothetical protein [Clostridium estertheticum]MCB2349646.1 hypothetical protein [Clostridium estertheticum]WAG46808.1 hypothetical protein LL127_04470 [Clostridium estertheticum]
MLYYAKLNLSKEKDEISKGIFKAYINGENNIDIVSVFYNSSDIFLKTIVTYANENKNILYITNEDERNTDILYYINKFSNLGQYVYSSTTNHRSESGYLYICNHENALKLQEKFDLVIYNDIRSFPKFNREQIKNILLKMRIIGGLAIAYCVENVLSEDNTIMFPIKNANIPIIEPRIITTRINLSLDIPLVVYEYLNWSIISNRKVIIFVPDAQKAMSVFAYLSNFKKKLSENIVLFIKSRSDDNIKVNFMNKDKGILVTNDFEENHLEFHSIDVIVYFADNVKFDYKQLFFLSSKVGRFENIQRGEAIFLANAQTVQMDKAKSMASKFNEKAWERGLLNI